MRENLDQMDFVIASYAIGLACIVGLVVWSIVTMRRAERRRQKVRGK
jgi:heme exporter protein CcmD